MTANRKQKLAYFSILVQDLLEGYDVQLKVCAHKTT